MKHVVALTLFGVVVFGALSACGGGGGGGAPPPPGPTPILYGADGKTGATVGAPAGNLYTIDITTGATTLIGPIAGPTGVTGLAMSPGGVMFLAECNANMAADTIGTVDVTTGMPTFIGNTGLGGAVADMTFVGSTLIGHSDAFAGDIVTINPATGVGTVLAGGPMCCGNGIAANAAGIVYLASSPSGTNPPSLYTVNPVTGATALIGPVTGLTYNRINSMAFLAGVLYAVDSDFATNNILGTINVATAAFTPIGPLLGTIDAIEGNFK
ncbi:MAG: NHL repeat-containing protein [Planctomycetota bacterium]